MPRGTALALFFLSLLVLPGCSLIRKDIDESDRSAHAERSTLIEDSQASAAPNAGIEALNNASSKDAQDQFDWDEPVSGKAAPERSTQIPQGPPLEGLNARSAPTVPSAPPSRPAENLPPAPRDPSLSSGAPTSRSPQSSTHLPNEPQQPGGNIEFNSYRTPPPSMSSSSLGAPPPVAGPLFDPRKSEEGAESPSGAFVPDSAATAPRSQDQFAQPPRTEYEASPDLARAVRSSGFSSDPLQKGFTPSAPPGAVPPSFVSDSAEMESLMPPMPDASQPRNPTAASAFERQPSALPPSAVAQAEPTGNQYLQPPPPTAAAAPNEPNLLVSAGPGRSDAAAQTRPVVPPPAAATNEPLPDAATLKQQGVDQYRKKEFGLAILSFKRYLDNYPDGSQEVRWRLAQALLENKQWGEASKEFNELRGAPQPEYRADALLKLGIIDEKRGDMPAARRQWQQVVDSYANTEAAKRASKLLSESPATASTP